MSIYNINIPVKYYDIQGELLKKQPTSNKNKRKKQRYTQEDIYAICNKLYRDELTSVFGGNTIVDDVIDKNMKELFYRLVLVDEFREMLQQIDERVHQTMIESNYAWMFKDENKEDTEDEQKRIEYLYPIYLVFFNEDFFHITHRLVCQLLTSAISTQTIDDGCRQLLGELKEKTIHYFVERVV